MMPNNQSQFHALHQRRHIAEYSATARTYRENNRDEIIARQRNSRRRNMELSRLHNENEYLGKTSLDDITLLCFNRDQCIMLSFNAVF